MDSESAQLFYPDTHLTPDQRLVMPDRFFVDSPISGQQATVSGDSAHHILNVMRMNVGDPLILFDGSGSEFQGVILSKSRKDVIVRIDQTVEVDRELKQDLTLAVALPKGDRQKWLVEKLVEVGVTRLIPLQTDRSVAVAGKNLIPKLNRRVVDASRQSGRNRLMAIGSPMSFCDLLSADHGGANCFVADPRVDDAPAGVIAGSIEPDASAVIAIGPEGGFTSEEISLAHAANWRTIQLGPTILRVETAAIVAAVVFGIGRN